jgi:hypothetical protein
MSDENVQYLVAKVKPLIAKKVTVMRSAITPEARVALSVFVTVWIRESGLGPPTHVRANSKPAVSRAPPKVLTSQARIGQVRLVTLHTRTSLIHWNPSPAGLASHTRTCMGTFTARKSAFLKVLKWLYNPKASVHMAKWASNIAASELWDPR